MPDTAGPPVVRSYIARVDDVDSRSRSLVATINTGSVDRYRTTIDPKGIDYRNYMKNRVVLWEHGRDPQRGSMPIGRNEWMRPVIGPNGPELRAKTCFHSGRKGDEFTERLFECYKDGDMRAWSVNVVPMEGCGPPTRDEIEKNSELADCLCCYRNSELAEYSAVSVGGQAEALTCDEARSILKCVSRGLTLPGDLVAAAKRAEAAADPTAIARRIGRDGPKYLALARDGQEIGRYDTEQEAREQVARLLADEHEPDPEPELPPLGGRPLAARRAEVLGQLRGLMDQARADWEMQRDWQRGRV